MRKNSRHGDVRGRGAESRAPEGGVVVDLGLQALIEQSGGKSVAEAAPESRPDVPSESPVAPVSQSVLHEEDVEVEIGSTRHLIALREQGDWSEISILCEERIAAIGPSDLEARAWWVLSQRELARLPFALLTAPLESLSGDVLSAEDVSLETRSLVARLTAAAVPLLRQRGEASLADTFEQRARELKPDLFEIPVERSEPSPEQMAKAHPRGPSGHPGAGSRRSEAVTRKRTRVGPVIASALALSGLLSAVAMTRGTATEAPLDAIRLYSARVNDTPPRLAVPQSLPMVGMSQLDAVLYDLDGRPPSKSAPTSSPAVEMKSQDDRPSVIPVAPAPAMKPTRRGQKEAINTSGPSEPADFLRHIEEPPADRGLKEPSPFERGGSPVAIRTDGEMGRREGTPATMHRAPRYYKILVRTEVFSSPTRTSYTIAELQQGDHVEVEAEIGEWLKVRSRRGSPGFILARDAVVENKTREQYAVRR